MIIFARQKHIDLYFELLYNQEFYDYIEQIIEDWIERKPKKCVDWFEKMITNALLCINKKEEPPVNVFFTAEEVINYIAKHQGQKLSYLMEQLVKLRLSGVYVGNLENLFQSYKLVSERKIRESVRVKFLELYKMIKEFDPNLIDMKW